ncbi:MAG: rod-binding protein [Sneathiella sp.]
MSEYLNTAAVFSAAQTTQDTNSNSAKDLAARASAEDFEAFFLSQMMNNMSSGLETDETFGGGQSEKIFKSMLNDEYSKSMSRQGGIGIADMVYREILALQEE